MLKISCPKCNSDGFMSLKQSVYQGPYRCWKCKEVFTIRVENNELKSCQPFSEQELEQLNIRDHYK